MTAARQLEKRGEIRGEIRGIELGIQNKAKAIAKNMLKEGCDISLIQRVTGLSAHTIEELKKEE